MMIALLLLLTACAAAQVCHKEFEVGFDVNDYAADQELGTRIFERPTFKTAGYVTAWDVYINKTNVPVYVSVFRRDRFRFLFPVGSTKISAEKVGKLRVELKESEYISVQYGDVIGIHYDEGSEGGAIAVATFESPCSSDGKCLEPTDIHTSLQFDDLTESDWKTGEEIDSFAYKRYKSYGSPAVKAILCEGELTTTVPVTTPEPMPESTCALPFEYKGQTYTTCTTKGSSYSWCSLDAKYSGKYKECRAEEGDPIPALMPCYKGFLYKGQKHDTCISGASGRGWCSVQSEYNDENWRHCRKGDPLPEHVPCHLPFQYKGETKSACIKSKVPWCATGEDPEKDWRYCRPVTIITHHTQAHDVQTAKKLCQERNLILADRRDVLEAWELGQDSCYCGWVSEGYKVSFLHESNCEEYQRLMLEYYNENNGVFEKGVNKCKGLAVPLCVSGN